MIVVIVVSLKKKVNEIYCFALIERRGGVDNQVLKLEPEIGFGRKDGNFCSIIFAFSSFLPLFLLSSPPNMCRFL
jgi:hypothetical protein